MRCDQLSGSSAGHSCLRTVEIQAQVILNPPCAHNVIDRASARAEPHRQHQLRNDFRRCLAGRLPAHPNKALRSTAQKVPVKPHPPNLSDVTPAGEARFRLDTVFGSRTGAAGLGLPRGCWPAMMAPVTVETSWPTSHQHGGQGVVNRSDGKVAIAVGLGKLHRDPARLHQCALWPRSRRSPWVAVDSIDSPIPPARHPAPRLL